jgi:RNA polymerase sigma-70 factor (ECF subfamily)
MGDLTLTELQRIAAAGETADVAFQMDEDAFRAFYDRTARGLCAYLSRLTGDRQLAEDLLQEAYYRFLRARRPYESEAHRRNSLFRIATNLVTDTWRKPSMTTLPEECDLGALQVGHDSASRAVDRTDVRRALARLKPRERALLWLAYAQGASHREIADVLGLKTGSIKLLLFRARRKMANLLRGGR